MAARIGVRLSRPARLDALDLPCALLKRRVCFSYAGCVITHAYTVNERPLGDNATRARARARTTFYLINSAITPFNAITLYR